MAQRFKLLEQVWMYMVFELMSATFQVTGR